MVPFFDFVRYLYLYFYFYGSSLSFKLSCESVIRSVTLRGVVYVCGLLQFVVKSVFEAPR